MLNKWVGNKMIDENKIKNTKNKYYIFDGKRKRYIHKNTCIICKTNFFAMHKLKIGYCSRTCKLISLCNNSSLMFVKRDKNGITYKCKCGHLRTVKYFRTIRFTGLCESCASKQQKYDLIVRNKTRGTKNRNWRAKYDDYIKEVRALTRKTREQVFNKEQLSKLGRCGTNGALQIDHMFTIKDGFLNNVAPQTIAHPGNLNIISWRENDTKKSKSNISYIQLLKRIELHNLATTIGRELIYEYK